MFISFHCAYINSETKIVGITGFLFKNGDNFEQFIIDENNIYSKRMNTNYSIIYVEMTERPDCFYGKRVSDIQNQIWKFSYMKRQLMAEIKNPDTIIRCKILDKIRCKILDKKNKHKLHIELFELFAHEMNIDYVFENLKLFDNW